MGIPRSRIVTLGVSAALSLVMILGAYFYWFSSSIFSSSYSDEVSAEAIASGGRLRGQVVVRNQGAFSSFNTLVVISTGMSNDPVILLSCSGRREINLAWIDEMTLRIAAPVDCDRLPNDAPHGVSVRFEALQ